MGQVFTRFSLPVRVCGLCLLLLAIGAIVLNPLTAHAAVWTSTAPFGTYYSNGYTLDNNVWGSGPGPQTIWANSAYNWGVWSNQPNTNGVKSYPYAGINVGRTLSSLGSVTSNFNVTVPGRGVYETAYDIWAGNHADEIMLWMNITGARPLGSYQTTVSVGGYSWNVYSGSNGSNKVFSFLNTGYATSGSVNILSVLRWAENRGWYGDVTLNQVQFGFEISASSGGLNYMSNYTTISYS